MSKFGVFGHFFWNRSLRVSNLLHYGRMQNGASFEYGATFGKNLNPVLIRGLSRDLAFFQSIWIEISKFFTFSL